MDTSDEVDQLAAAYGEYAKAPATCRADKENRQFAKGRDVYRYASLTALQMAAVPRLAAQGLTINQCVSTGPGGEAVVTTRLNHVSGQWMASTLAMAADRPNCHGFASAATYAQRLGLRAMVQVMVGDELDPDDGGDILDDDGNQASGIDERDAVSVLLDYEQRGLPKDAVAAYRAWANAEPVAPEPKRLEQLDRLFARLEREGRLEVRSGLREPQGTSRKGRVSNSGALLSS